MQQTDRVSQVQISQLYRALRFGIYDRELLIEVGWALHARCGYILAVTRATRGEVPCPRCNEIVVRARHARRVAAGRIRRGRHLFGCPGCGAELTWEGCQQALLDAPRCFTCQSTLRIDYTKNQLQCPRCKRVWWWRNYRASVKARRWLLCPECDRSIRHPQPSGDKPHRCLDTTTAPYKKRPERLHCLACGHQFSWAAWRRQHSIIGNRTGNPLPVQRYWERWPCGGNQEQQFIEIDALLHTMHIRGAMAHLFIEGSEASLRALLDELAQA